MALEPLEVFALTSDMQRATGSIPYTSLMWNRKYYEVGDFLMEVPANVYDPSWAYIYTDERPETGIIQKVEYSDTSTVAGGVDTVILSGFFMEAELNRYTFLVEETEEEAYRIYKPSPAKTKRPTMWSDNLGMTYVKTGERWETIDGDYVDPSTINQSELNEIDVLLGDGMQRKMYPTTNTGKFPSGYWSTGEYSNSNYAYYSSDGKTLHSVAPDGTETTYGIVSGGGTGDVIYEDEDGFHWVNGVASSLGDTYVRAVDSWERMVHTEGLEVVEGDNTIFGGSTYARAYRTVKGPWQLRTELDVNEPADNVQRIIQWAQDIYGNNLLYDEVGFAGEEKIIDPSLKLFGDLAYEELKTVGASPRLFYSFESDTCVFQVWRGLDRTQSQAGVPAPPTPDEPDEPTIDDLYEPLDYIVSTGAQYIDTGFTPGNENVAVSIDFAYTANHDSGALFGAQSSSGAPYCLVPYGAGPYIYAGSSSKIITLSTLLNKRHSLEVRGVSGTVTTILDGATQTAAYSGSIIPPCPLFVLANNHQGTAKQFTSARVYSCQIYDNGTPVRDYVPRRRVSDGAVGMLDLANGTFYESAGSEPFYAPGELPSGYTRLEYIESTGSQYIDTGFKPNQDTSVVIDMQGGNSAAANGTQMFYGVGSQPYFQFGKSSSSNWGIRAYYNATYTDPLATWDQSSFKSTRRTITQDKNKIEVDGISHEFTYAAFSCAYTMYLFGVNSADGFKFATAMKVYSCRIGDNGTIVRDYIPVRNSSGEAGLFDLVTMTFYADASGTGFVAGPEVAQVAEASAFSLMRTAAASNESNTAANPFAVFSDTWGTLYGFTASKDVSNYRNTCYVLYQFRDQTDADGNPIGPRGYVKARLEDELPDAETYLDLRGEEPEADQTDEAFIESLRQRGLAHLQANYAAIESLDTGTLAGNGYLTGYDLGDKVDMLVEAIGLVKEARITGVCEVHEAGSSTATLEIGEQKITNIRKAVIV